LEKQFTYLHLKCSRTRHSIFGKGIDAELAAILKAQLPAILLLSENVSQRTAARQKFNEVVFKQLDPPKVVLTEMLLLLPKSPSDLFRRLSLQLVQESRGRSPFNFSEE
jgi:hypothetical protein